MTKFSAHLGFLWTDRSLPNAIRAAKAAGFDAVECHWPYQYPPAEVAAALQETGLAMLGLNTRPGNVDAGDKGLAALPGRNAEARTVIDEAIAYAAAIGAANIHVMAGIAEGPAAAQTFQDNLSYACDQAKRHGQTILIEPLNHYDMPGYFLSTTTQAVTIIEALALNNLKLMFDCYHVQLMEGDLSHRLQRLLPLIGHIQFSAAPGRGVPDQGEINFRHIFKLLMDLGYSAPLGAEYNPGGDTDASLGWLRHYRSDSDH